MTGSRSLAALAVISYLLLAGGEARSTSAATTATPVATTLTASDDGYVDSSRPAKSLGAATTLQVGSRRVLRSYLKFDLALTGGTVTSAVLKLTATSASKTGFGVREVADSSWTEHNLRYTNAPPVSRSVGASARPFAPRQVLTIDVTASVKAGVRSFALVVRGGAAALSVGSSENRSPAFRPRLVVTVTPPEPEQPHGACGWLATPRKVDHVIWIWMENKPFDVINVPDAPFEKQLSQSCGLATSYHAVTHPSLPNYLAATSGGTHGIRDDSPPASHPIGTPSIFSQVKDLGKTWRSYQESSPGNCPLESSGRYAVKHDPAPYYTGIRGDCAAWDVPMGTTDGGTFLSDLTNGTLPAFSFVTPDVCNDTHDCSVATGDAWLQAWFAKIIASPTYQAGKTVVFLNWDEDDLSGTNRVAMIVVSPSTKAGTVSDAPFDHYALLKTTEQLLGITTFLGSAGDPATASMTSAYNLG